MDSISETLFFMIIINTIILIIIGCIIWAAINERLLTYETRISMSITDLKSNLEVALNIISESLDPVPDECYKDKLSYNIAAYILNFSNGNGISNAAIQRHFSMGVSRANRIIHQLVLLKVCKRLHNGNVVAIIDLEQLNQMAREGKL